MHAAAPTPDGGFVVLLDEPDKDPAIHRIGKDGHETWMRRWPGARVSHGEDRLVVLPSGDVAARDGHGAAGVVAGREVFSFNSINTNVDSQGTQWLVCLDGDGRQVGKTLVDGAMLHFDMASAPDGRILLAGYAARTFLASVAADGALHPLTHGTVRGDVPAISADGSRLLTIGYNKVLEYSMRDSR